MEEYDLDQREEDLTLLLHVWPDIEEALLKRDVNHDYDYDGKRFATVAASVRQAFRVEVQGVTHTFGEEGWRYVLLYDVNDYSARQAAAALNDNSVILRSLQYKHARMQGHNVDFAIQIVPNGKPIGGEVCPRVMASPVAASDLRDLPEPEPPATDVPLVERGHHRLTPIEAPFYDALMQTKLVFAVQPRVQGPDRLYRPDFIVFYAGRAVVVELDGHEGHKTKQQRVDDSKRQLWFESKDLRVLRWTGTQVYADADMCVQQLLAILRGSAGSP